VSPSDAPAPPAAIIVVSGLPRSGTSMLMQMLEAGGVPVLSDAVRTPDASNPRGYYELERVKRLRAEADKAWLTDGQGKALKIISFLLPHLPDVHSYQVIFMLRPLPEIVASQNRMLEDLAQERGNANEAGLLESYDVHLASVRSFLASRPWFATLDVHYRDIVAQPAAEAIRIARFLGRDLDIARMASAVEPRLYRNRLD
jgi:hypothetical protein